MSDRDPRIEVAAKAIHADHEVRTDGDFSWDELGAPERERHLSEGRASVAALDAYERDAVMLDWAALFAEFEVADEDRAAFTGGVHAGLRIGLAQARVAAPERIEGDCHDCGAPVETWDYVDLSKQERGAMETAMDDPRDIDGRAASGLRAHVRAGWLAQRSYALKEFDAERARYKTASTELLQDARQENAKLRERVEELGKALKELSEELVGWIADLRDSGLDERGAEETASRLLAIVDKALAVSSSVSEGERDTKPVWDGDPKKTADLLREGREPSVSKEHPGGREWLISPVGGSTVVSHRASDGSWITGMGEGERSSILVVPKEGQDA
jgi:hypothetical protein